MSLFVDDARSLSGFDEIASSLLSGEKSYCTAPLTWNAGKSCLPGVRSRISPLSAFATNVCVYLPSRHAVQWRYSSSSAMCALSLPCSRRSALRLLHASFAPHSGYTSLENAIHFPSGDQIGSATPV